MVVKPSATKWIAAIAVTAALIATAVLLASGSGGDEEDLIRGNVASDAVNVTFDSAATWTVPEGVTTITITATGEHGADNYALGGSGVTVIGTVTVTPGEKLLVRVASGPGDCSGVFRSLTTSGSIIIAAGGGSAGEYVPVTGIMPRSWVGYGGAAVGARMPAYPTPPGGTPGVTPDGYWANWPKGLFSGGTASLQVGWGGFGGLSGFVRPNLELPQPGEAGAGGSFLTGGPGGRGGTSAELAQWVRGKNLLSPDYPVTFYPQLGNGGRGGSGGCGYVGGQGGQGGSSGAGGGGGGGGLSFIEQGATNVSSNTNSMKLRKANVTITFTPVAPSTIALVTTTELASETIKSTTSSSAPEVSPTAPTTVAPSSVQTTIPATTPTTTSATTPVTAPRTPTYRAMNVYSLRTLAGVPSGVRVRSAKVATGSRSVCAVLRDLVVTLKAGTCKLTVSISNGRKTMRVSSTITIQP